MSEYPWIGRPMTLRLSNSSRFKRALVPQSQGIHHLWRCDSSRLCRSRRERETVLLEEGPMGQEDRPEGLAEPSPRQVGLHGSRRDPSEVPSQDVVRKEAAWHRADPAGFVPPEGYRARRGQDNAGPHPHAPERAPPVPPRDDDRVPEGHECDPDSPGAVAHERDVVRSELLGPWLWCEHRRAG